MIALAILAQVKIWAAAAEQAFLHLTDIWQLAAGDLTSAAGIVG